MNILLTGGSRGLGLEIARRQLEQGHVVYIVNRSVSDELSQLITKYGETAKFLKCDLSKPETIKHDVFEVIKELGFPIHALVNNAAVAYDDLVTNLNLDRAEELMRTNVLSPMELTKQVIRNMLLHKVAGSIVHISSISAHTGYKGLAMYAASKGAIEAFSKNVAREWGSKGIRSNCVVPGFMETNMSSGLSAEQKARVYNRTALKQATEIESVAAAVDFLLSESSSSMTGQNVFVDSGTI